LDVLDLIMGRRSIREFTPDPVPSEILDDLLRAAMAAPSASNRKPWEFVVVTDPGQLAKLRRTLVLGRYEAPAAVVVCGNTRRSLPGPARSFWVEDCSAAMENLLLCAHGLGLGTVWIGIHPLKPFERGVQRTLSLPRHIVPLGLAHIGYAAQECPPRTQYDPRRVHWQRYAGSNREDA